MFQVPIAESSSLLTLKRWTVADYRQMLAAGVLTAEDRVELLDGQIIEMVPQDPPHAATTDESSDYLKGLFLGKAKVRAQLPITLSEHSEPEPDIAVVRIDANRYCDRHPNPADIYLLIEIADATLRRDLDHKSKLYAQAEIPEYWVIDVQHRQVIVFRNPINGSYTWQQSFAQTELIAPVSFPDLTVRLQSLLI